MSAPAAAATPAGSAAAAGEQFSEASVLGAHADHSEGDGPVTSNGATVRERSDQEADGMQLYRYNGDECDHQGEDVDDVNALAELEEETTDELRSPTSSRIPIWVRPKDADRDSGVDEGREADQSASPQKARSPSKRLQNPAAQEKQKKVPMNKIQVGTAASPNIKNVKSRVGSLANTSYKPGGGNVKIESHKIDVSKAGPKVAATSSYKPQGGNKKIETHKVEWNAHSKVGSMKNASYKPGGGNVKVNSQKLDYKDKAVSKVGSRTNLQHKPGGGDVKVETVKVDLTTVGSRINSLANVSHKPQGGDKKIFNDTAFLRQISSNSERRKSQASSVDEPSPVTSSPPKSPTKPLTPTQRAQSAAAEEAAAEDAADQQPPEEAPAAAEAAAEGAEAPPADQEAPADTEAPEAEETPAASAEA